MPRYSIPFLLLFQHYDLKSDAVHTAIEILQASQVVEVKPTDRPNKRVEKRYNRRHLPVLVATCMPSRDRMSEVTSLLNKLGPDNVREIADQLFRKTSSSDNPRQTMEGLSMKSLEQDVIVAPLFANLSLTLFKKDPVIKQIYMAVAKARFDAAVSSPGNVNLVKLSAAMAQLSLTGAISQQPLKDLTDHLIRNLGSPHGYLTALALIHESDAALVKQRSRALPPDLHCDVFHHLLRAENEKFVSLSADISNSWKKLPTNPLESHANISLYALRIIIQLRISPDYFHSFARSILDDLQRGENSSTDDVEKLLLLVTSSKLSGPLQHEIRSFAHAKAFNKENPAKIRFKMMDILDHFSKS